MDVSFTNLIKNAIVPVRLRIKRDKISREG